MKTRLQKWIQRITVCVCVLCFLCPVLTTYADELDDLENESAKLQEELDSKNSEMLAINEQIAENELELDTINNNITRLQDQIDIARSNETAYYEDMRDRIRYIYENQGESLLGMILSAEDISDFVNRVHFVQTLSEYDRSMFSELQNLRQTIEEEEGRLKEQQDAGEKLEEELQARWAELEASVADDSADMEKIKAKIEDIKAEQAAAAAAAAAQAANSNKVNGGGSTGGGSTGSGSTGNSGSTGGGGYAYPSGPGQLNPFVGVVYFNGHRETYYSQKVLPGGGLNIPGRHVASDGTIRDANGYICVASSDYPKGTIVETSLGTGMVYDSGCASGTIDIYTDW